MIPITPSSTRRVALGGIVHETHSFAEPHTTLADFQRSLCYGEDILKALSGSPSSIAGMIQGATERRWTLLPTVHGSASPGGTVVEEAYRTMLRELVRRLKGAMPVDGVLLDLHGAMVTEEQLDPEGDILAKVRAVVGARVPIVIVLDMHGNISPQMVGLADVILAYDTNPHLDAYPRGVEAADVLDLLMRGTINPTASLARPPFLLPPQATGTDDLPLRLVHERRKEMEDEEGVVAIAVMGGFAYGDTPFTGPSVVVTTDNDPDLAQSYAQELVEILVCHSAGVLPQFLAPEVAVREALARPGRPIILVDSADNVGGGTPGDGTDALKAMLALNVHEGTIVLADREAVAACWAAGVGAEVTLAVGGKTDRWHGAPVPVKGVVRRLQEGDLACERTPNHFGLSRINMGRTAWLRVGGVNIILIEQKTPPFDLVQLRGVGVTPEEQKMIVVKSAVAYRAAYMPIAAGAIEMDTAGLCSANLSLFPYKHLGRPASLPGRS
jgi:microcystin degradation protein MlrC